ncbi:TetR/AcrR family transcriptional regulator [Brevibacillus fluminis]|nr:TetR/AcrR family transcriptional regulator [Brevibacillus fluminis]
MSIQKIKEVSLKLFSQNGYDGTSLSDISNGVGINKSTIYAHFKNKESIFLAVFDDALWDYNIHVEKLIEEIKNDPIEEKLFKILCDVSHYYTKNEDKKLFLRRSVLFPPAFLLEELMTRIATTDEALVKTLCSIFEEGIKEGIIQPGNIKDLVNSYLCVLDGLFTNAYYLYDENFSNRAQNIWKIFWKGIRV